MSFSVFNIAATGMHAQRVKMDTVSSNIANINTTRNEFGEKEVYHKKQVNFKEITMQKGFGFPKGKILYRLFRQTLYPPNNRNSDSVRARPAVLLVRQGYEYAQAPNNRYPCFAMPVKGYIPDFVRYTRPRVKRGY